MGHLQGAPLPGVTAATRATARQCFAFTLPLQSALCLVGTRGVDALRAVPPTTSQPPANTHIQIGTRVCVCGGGVHDALPISMSAIVLA